MAKFYLLDTTVLLHWTRWSDQARAFDEQFQLTHSALRPLISIVSVGEMRAFSRKMNCNDEKRQRLEQMQRHVVTIDISDSRVLDAYADLSTEAQANGGSIFHGKNDLWIGACARAAGAHLLTMDTDFRPLKDVLGWPVTLLDPGSGLPVT